MEDGTQSFRSNWSGEGKRGLVWTESPDTMRIDLKLLYILLTIPRDLRKSDYNVLSALQLCRSNTISARVSDYFEGGKTSRWSGTEGVPDDNFLSTIEGVSVQYTPYSAGALAGVLSTLISFGLGFIPVVGPLLAAGSSLVMGAIADPNSPSIKELLTAEFGLELGLAILESALGYKGHKKQPGSKIASDAPLTSEQVSMPTSMRPVLTMNKSADDYKLTTNIKEPTNEEKQAYQTNGPKQDGDATIGGPLPVA